MAELVYALVLGTSTARFKSSSLFLPTKIYESTLIQKGLKTSFSVLVDKKIINKKLDEKLLELQQKVHLKGFRLEKYQPQSLKISLEKLFTVKS